MKCFNMSSCDVNFKKKCREGNGESSVSGFQTTIIIRVGGLRRRPGQVGVTSHVRPKCAKFLCNASRIRDHIQYTSLGMQLFFSIEITDEMSLIIWST